MGMGFRWLTTDEEFRSLESRWRELFASNPSHRVFLSWEWVSNWWRCFGQGRQAKILLAEDNNGRAMTILPFCVTEKRILGKSYLREWNFIGAESLACSDHLGYLKRADVDERVVRQMLDVVWEQVTGRDLLRFIDMESVGAVVESIESWAEAKQIRIERVAGPECPLARLPESWEIFLNGLSKKFRAEVRLKARRVAGNPELRLIQVTDPKEAADIVSDLVRLSRLRLSDRGVRSTLSDPRMEAFLKTAVPAMVESGLAWLDVLRHGEKNIAVTFHLCDQGAIAFYQGGFDPEYAWYSPMIVLLAHVIERAISSKYRDYDFLRGNEDYKYRWGAQAMPSSSLFLYPTSTLRLILDRGIRYFEKVTRALGNRLLERGAGASPIERTKDG